ncbi:MAG TPA: acyltransferase [Sphingomonas sp.]|nr:acyltransferase [Sphingomonas sp.]
MPFAGRFEPSEDIRARPVVSRESEPPVRAAIGVVRVLAILGIVYVHAWTGRSAEHLNALSGTPQGLLRWALIELLGRSAVPLLGAISGFLVAPSIARRGYRGFIGTKARTILAPMLLWNVIAMTLVGAFATWGRLKGPVPSGPMEALDWLGCITGPNPINVQIAFLRDLFLCMAAAPLLTRTGDRRLWAVWALAVAWSVAPAVFPLMLRPPILVFFVSGMLARRYGLPERIANWPLLAACAPFLLLVPVKIGMSAGAQAWGQTHPHLANLIDLPFRFAAALALWRIAIALAPRGAGKAILRAEPYAFLLFCAHLTFIWLFGPLIGLWTGKLGAPLYPAFLLLQPLLVLPATIALGRTLQALSPRLAGLLSGGRLATPLPRAPAPIPAVND